MGLVCPSLGRKTAPQRSSMLGSGDSGLPKQDPRLQTETFGHGGSALEFFKPLRVQDTDGPMLFNRCLTCFGFRRQTIRWYTGQASSCSVSHEAVPPVRQHAGGPAGCSSNKTTSVQPAWQMVSNAAADHSIDYD